MFDTEAPISRGTQLYQTKPREQDAAGISVNAFTPVRGSCAAAPTAAWETCGACLADDHML